MAPSDALGLNNFENHNSAEIEWGGDPSNNVSSVANNNEEAKSQQSHNFGSPSQNKEESKNSENIHEM